MSLAVLFSRALCGLHAPVVRVETHVGPGLPAFHIVGLADTEVRESRDRVRAAIASSGLDFPSGRITVNLSPADLPKQSSRFDLPIALGVLIASGQIAVPRQGADGRRLADLADWVFAGELSLTGAVVGVEAPLAIAIGVARTAEPGCPATLVLPSDSAPLAARVPGLRVLAAVTLADVGRHLAGASCLDRAPPVPAPAVPGAAHSCLSEVRGLAAARRALEVAASGGHSVLMTGPPGSGKSMLARRLPGLLPPLSAAQSLEVAALADLAGVDPPDWTVCPFRSPHHGASAPALVGGGHRPRPGEITLAHHGVLFLDELPEFERHTLESLREPLESGSIMIARSRHSTRFPARFQLVAAMNPCPCGWLGHTGVACTCSPEQIARYRRRVSGPLLDRIDVRIEVTAPSAAFIDLSASETSAIVRERVTACQVRQRDRQKCVNAALTGEQIVETWAPVGPARALLRDAFERFRLSARAVHRVMRVAKTIADMEQSDRVQVPHLSESLQYRGEI